MEHLNIKQQIKITQISKNEQKKKYKMWYINAIICKHIKKEYFANKILNTI